MLILTFLTKIQPQGEFQPGVAYKSVPYKKKRVIHEDRASKYVSRLEKKKFQEQESYYMISDKLSFTPAIEHFL